MGTKGFRIYLLVAVVVSVVLAFSYTTPGGDVGYLVAYAANCGLAWWAALTRRSGVDRRPWILIASSQSLWFAGDVLELTLDYFGTLPPIGVSDALWLGGYPLLTAAMVQLARRRAPGRLRGAVLDGLTVAVAAGMASWQFIIATVFDRGFGFAEAVVPALYPVADVVLLAGVLFVALSPGTRTAPTRLLLTAVGCYLAVDLGYNVVGGSEYVERLAVGLLLGNALIVGAALHPASAELTRPGHQVSSLHPARVLFLGLALMTTPVLTILPGGVDLPAPAVLVGTVTCAAFVLARFTIAVRELERAQAQLTFHARRDPLTGLANRMVLSDRLRRALPGSGYPVTLLYLDLDGFKAVNDAHGHDAGDAVLQAVATRLSAVVRESDLVARLGGDEFALLCPGVLADDAIRLAERIVRDVAEPVSFHGTPLTVGVSIGINAHVDRPGVDPAAVLRSADAAMYAAKRLGRGRWVLADGRMPVAEPAAEPVGGPVAG
jgi:diguanylate cyclase (GGDEF)-like protein